MVTGQIYTTSPKALVLLALHILTYALQNLTSYL